MKHRLIRKLQSMMFPEFVNGMEPRGGKKGYAQRGKLYSDLCYGTEYPNSFLDLYQSLEYPGEKRPVFLYCHGGGYTWGDKVEGDPNAKERQGFALFQAYLDAGYHVVSVNYALAPEYTYPVPLLQLNQCVCWLPEHREKYGLDMGQVIFGGGSAGAHLAGQYVNLITNPDYAREMGIRPPITPDQTLAFVSQSGLLDCERFDRTGSAVFDIVLRSCARAYFDVREIHGNPKVSQSNVITHMTERFPPCFLSDGNTGTFTDQAMDMEKRAKELGIPARIQLYDREEAKLGHGFEGGDSPQAREVLELTLEFLKTLRKG